MDYSSHSRHSARPRRADGGNPFSGLNETSRCTHRERVERRASARLPRSSAEAVPSTGLSAAPLIISWVAGTSKWCCQAYDDPVCGPWPRAVRRTSSNSAVFAALRDTKTSAESFDEARQHHVCCGSRRIIYRMMLWPFALFSFGASFSSTFSKIRSNDL